MGPTKQLVAMFSPLAVAAPTGAMPFTGAEVAVLAGAMTTLVLIGGGLRRLTRA